MSNYLLHLVKILLMYNATILGFHMQADYIGRTMLSKLLHDWRLLDELSVLRAIYLLGSGISVRPFQNFLHVNIFIIYL